MRPALWSGSVADRKSAAEAATSRPDRTTAVEAARVADERWTAALDNSEFAPPDPGFGDRVRELADATEQEAAALRLADQAGLGWNPVPNARNMRLSHETRPGANRPGPAELWQQFDTTVQRLGIAMEGVALSAVGRAFAELSEIAREISEELSGRRRRRRRAS
jgi:hypothetical protein